MGDLSRHFSRAEFLCKGNASGFCECGRDTVDVELIQRLEEIREYAGFPMTISSGNRCVDYNQSIGGAMQSLHMRSKAADFQFLHGQAYSLEELYSWMDEMWPSKYGMGLYSRWIHLDVRPGKARWDKRSS